MTGSTGTLFLYGIAVGALAVLGLSLRIALYAAHPTIPEPRAGTSDSPAASRSQIATTQSVTARLAARRLHVRGGVTDLPGVHPRVQRLTHNVRTRAMTAEPTPEGPGPVPSRPDPVPHDPQRPSEPGPSEPQPQPDPEPPPGPGTRPVPEPPD
ncbi:hypothetical protein GCM10010207_74970 [Streptomyces atratus]|nr:hypothetical protein GCM10010207_74970 [Streptomyces atratus]